MATLQSAQQKWERKTAGAGGRWKQATSGAGGRYAEGLTKFLGSAPSSAVVSRYSAGVDATSASDFDAAIAGKGSKWAEATRRGLTSG